MHVKLRNFRTKAIHGSVGLVTNWQPIARVISVQAFNDLCRLADAPVWFMDQLPATLACQIFNHRFRVAEGKRSIGLKLFSIEVVLDGETARAINF